MVFKHGPKILWEVGVGVSLPFYLSGLASAQTNKEGWKSHYVTFKARPWKVMQLHLVLLYCLLSLSPQPHAEARPGRREWPHVDTVVHSSIWAPTDSCLTCPAPGECSNDCTPSLHVTAPPGMPGENNSSEPGQHTEMQETALHCCFKPLGLEVGCGEGHINWNIRAIIYSTIQN